MLRRQPQLLAAALLLIVAAGINCNESALPPLSQTCSANTCTGCCDSNGFCQNNPEALGLCGLNGRSCEPCSGAGQICRSGYCIDGNADGGGPPRLDSGTSVTNCGNCSGCCSKGSCIEPGNEDEFCGKPGQACEPCSSSKLICDKTSRSCVSPCSADNCSGCCRDSDGDGVVDSCVALADQKTDRCGNGGAKCTACASGCNTSSGTCTSTQPNCTGKCAGDSDGAGGTCSKNDCDGCCDLATKACRPGNKVDECGIGGERCWPCPTGWICNAVQKCDACGGKSDGDACTLAGSNGKCRSAACCTGCWTGSSCNTANNLTNTASCGIGGGDCQPCGNGKTCKNGSCVTSTTGGTKWQVYAYRIKVRTDVFPARWPAGNAWDNLSTGIEKNPDPRMTIDWYVINGKCSPDAVWPHSPKKTNTFDAIWDDVPNKGWPFLTTPEDESTLTSNDYCVFALDTDGALNPDDNIAKCGPFRLTTTDLNNGYKRWTNCPSTDFNGNFIELLELRFAKVP